MWSARISVMDGKSGKVILTTWEHSDSLQLLMWEIDLRAGIVLEQGLDIAAAREEEPWVRVSIDVFQSLTSKHFPDNLPMVEPLPLQTGSSRPNARGSGS